MHIQFYSFPLPKQHQALRLLNLVQHPEKIDNPYVKIGFKSFTGRRGGFSHQLEQFFYRQSMLDRNNSEAFKDAVAIAQNCEIVDRSKKEKPEALLLINAEAVEMLSPGFLSRFNKGKDGRPVIPVDDCHELADLSKKRLVPV